MLNARSERILEDSKSYWNKIKNKRCLIPVNGIYEHRAVPDDKGKNEFWEWADLPPLGELNP